MHRFKYLACALALAAAACSNNSSTVTTPTTTNNLLIDFTDATNGPLTRNGSQTFQFATLTAGTVGIQLNALNPDGPSGIYVGLAIGILDNVGACQRVVWNDHSQLSTQFAATATTAGNLCATIYDSTGTLPQPQTFDIQVSHP
jgi:hypothetical protein